MNDLTGKVAIVTGGATLIGAGIGQQIVAAGGKVVLADIAVDEGQQRADAIGRNCVFIETDVTSDTAIERCIAATLETFGSLDILVNVAGTYLDDGASTNRDDFLTSLNVNLVSQFIFAQKAAAVMRTRGGGAIVNMSSVSGKLAQPGRMTYPVSKAGVLHLTRCLAAGWASDGIRVNSVSPGWVWSNIIKAVSQDNLKKADKVGAPIHPLGRIARPEEIGDAVVYLASERASFVTGTDLAVDGGYTAIGPEQMVDMIPLLMDQP